MSDLISRKALIEFCSNSIDRTIDANDIMRFPSAEPERKWIPVTEALPEICEKDVFGNVTYSKSVWTCQKYDGYFWQSIDKYTTNNGGGWLTEGVDGSKVVAWMPLPEPYVPVGKKNGRGQSRKGTVPGDGGR